METGRALEQGEEATTSSFSAGWQHDGMIAYDMPGRGDENWRGGDRFPFYPHQLEWMVRYSRGVGAGVQADVAVISPTPMGLGLQLGWKWQLPLGVDWLAVAAGARGGGSFSGFGNLDDGMGIVTGHLDGGVVASVHPTDRHAVYISPRLRTDALYHRVWSDRGVDDATGRGTSMGGAAGIKLGNRGEEYFLETVALTTPRAEQTDGLRVMVGFGVRTDEGPSVPPW